MKRLLLTVFFLSLAATAQIISGGGSGNATALQGKPIAATAPASGNCLVFTTSWGPGACSGSASTDWSALASGTNTTGTFLIGSGASLAASGSGTIAATSVPASGLGAGTIANATTGNAATATACASANGCWPNSAAAVDALGELTNNTSGNAATATSATTAATATSANELNSGAVPTSKNLVGTNSSGQIVAGTSQWHCEFHVGDSVNAATSGTYVPVGCLNTTGSTITITGIKFYTDSGTSTADVKNGAGTSLLTGAITGTTSWAAGTQSATTTLAANDYLKASIVMDGTTKQGVLVVWGTY